MLNLPQLADTFVIAASHRGHTSDQIRKAFEVALQPMREKEKAAGHKQAAKEWTRDQVVDAFSESMAEFWGLSFNMEDLQLELKLRFPKHHKTIDNIFEWAADASNEREDTRTDGPSREYERGYDKVIRTIKRLPW